jgi:hypothetical protein
MNFEDSVCSTKPAFIQKNSGKPRKPSLRIACRLVELVYWVLLHYQFRAIPLHQQLDGFCVSGGGHAPLTSRQPE